MKTRFILCVAALLGAGTLCSAQNIELLDFGDFNNWITREIKESAVIGGNTKHVYEIAPEAVVTGNHAYRNMGGSPWATSNVYAKVAGVSKASNAVFPAERAGYGKCARLCTMLESVRVLHVVNMDVLVAGSIFLGEMIEPISDTKNPMRKMEMGVPFKRRPQFLTFDYKLEVPKDNIRIRSTGFGSKKTLTGRDAAVVFVMLQKRWEDARGNIHAIRVGTAGRTFSHATDWTDSFRLPIVYGDCSDRYDMGWLGLRRDSQCYYARNSKGRLVPVTEEGWGDGTETPTHLILMVSAANGEPYVGTPGMTFYVDNIGFGY